MAQQDRPAAVALGVQLPGVSEEEHASSLTELTRLGKTLGVQVVARISQRRAHLDKAAVVGKGKLRELAALTGGSGEIPVGPRGRRGGKDADADEAGEPDLEEAEADAREPAPAEAPSPAAKPDLPRATIVLVDHEISPSQARNLGSACGAEVLDRTAVILAIFQRHARSREARLQVEIARLTYWAPRVRESSAGKGRQGGGIGGRGAGESQLELDRRKVRDRIAELRTELAEIQRREGVRRSRRAERSRVALVGYTNAGKSSLMRGLTGSEVETADRLFATLDPTVRMLKPETHPRILVSDTVGFIKQLPHELVASFRSTLDEACEASLLLHVVDASDADFPAQLQVTLDVLADIGARDVPRLLLLNKIDKVDELRRESLRAGHPEALLLSAKLPADVAQLRERILAFFERDMVDAELRVPYAQQRLVSEIHDSCRVLSESYDERGTVLQLRAHPEVLERLRAAVEPS